MRANFQDIINDKGLSGDSLARAISDWVKGASLRTLADRYFDGSISKCCQKLFSKITQTASWGLAALQSLTLGDDLDQRPIEEQHRIRNIPGRVYYGVDTDEALVLRMAGVPRSAATKLATVLGTKSTTAALEVRRTLRTSTSGLAPWKKALGHSGEAYRMVWAIGEGEKI